jgi:hypothetical protein
MHLLDARDNYRRRGACVFEAGGRAMRAGPRPRQRMVSLLGKFCGFIVGSATNLGIDRGPATPIREEDDARNDQVRAAG